MKMKSSLELSPKARVAAIKMQSLSVKQVVDSGEREGGRQ